MSRLETENGITVVVLGRRYSALDSQALEQLRELFQRALESSATACLLLDAAQTEFFDSQFLELLVQLWKRLRERGGTLAFCALRPECRESLQATRLDTIWPVFPSRQEALARLADSSSGTT